MATKQLRDCLEVHFKGFLVKNSSLEIYLCECEINTVCKRSYHKTSVQTHILIAIGKRAGALPHTELIWLPVPVKTQLAFPLKLLSLQDATQERLAHMRLKDRTTIYAFRIFSVGWGVFTCLLRTYRQCLWHEHQ